MFETEYLPGCIKKIQLLHNLIKINKYLKVNVMKAYIKSDGVWRGGPHMR